MRVTGGIERPRVAVIVGAEVTWLGLGLGIGLGLRLRLGLGFGFGFGWAHDECGEEERAREQVVGRVHAPEAAASERGEQVSAAAALVLREALRQRTWLGVGLGVGVGVGSGLGPGLGLVSPTL